MLETRQDFWVLTMPLDTVRTRCIQMSSNWRPEGIWGLYTGRRVNKGQMKGTGWNNYVRVPWNGYVMEVWYYRVRVEETEKSYHTCESTWVVTHKGTFNMPATATVAARTFPVATTAAPFRQEEEVSWRTPREEEARALCWSKPQPQPLAFCKFCSNHRGSQALTGSYGVLPISMHRSHHELLLSTLLLPLLARTELSTAKWSSSHPPNLCWSTVFSPC